MMQTCTAQCIMVSISQYKMDALCQVGSITFMSHIAVFLMANHFWYAAYAKSHTWHTTGHGLHNGIGQIVLQRWYDEYISRIVSTYDT